MGACWGGLWAVFLWGLLGCFFGFCCGAFMLRVGSCGFCFVLMAGEVLFCMFVGRVRLELCLSAGWFEGLL